MEGKLNGLTGQNGVEVCRRIDFQPCGTGNRVGLLSGNETILNKNINRCRTINCFATIFLIVKRKPPARLEVLKALAIHK